MIKNFFVSTVFWSRKRICTNWAAYSFSQDGFFQFKFLTYYFDLVKKCNESEQEKCTCVTEKVQFYSSWIVHNKFTHFFIHNLDKQQTFFLVEIQSMKTLLFFSLSIRQGVRYSDHLSLTGILFWVPSVGIKNMNLWLN